MSSPHLPAHQLSPNQPQNYFQTQFSDDRNIRNVQQPNFQSNRISPSQQQSSRPIQINPNFRRRSYNMIDNNAMENGNNAPNMNKRAHMDDGTPYSNPNNETVQRSQAYDGSTASGTGTIMANPPATSGASTTSSALTSVVIGEDVINLYRLYEEHNLLRRRVEINEERLQELRATNSYLLHQNEQLRRQTQCSCTSTIVNPVTLTTTSQPQQAQVRILDSFRNMFKLFC